MTQQELDATRARLEAATPGPWEFTPSEYYGLSTLWNPTTRQEVMSTGGFNDGDSPITWMGEGASAADLNLISFAPADIRALLDEVEQLRNTIEWQQSEHAEEVAGLKSDRLRGPRKLYGYRKALAHTKGIISVACSYSAEMRGIMERMYSLLEPLADERTPNVNALLEEARAMGLGVK